MAVQLAKHFGAEAQACAVRPISTSLRSLGADHVIDGTKEDFSRNGVTYDVTATMSATLRFHAHAPRSRAAGGF